MASLSARALDWFGRFGASPIESGEVALRRHVLLGCSLACTVAGLLWSATYFAAGAPVAGAVPLAYAIISLASTAGFWFTGRYRLYLNTQLGLILLLPWMMSLALGGFQASSAVIIWSMLAPLGALLFDELRSATGWFAGFLGLVLSNAFLPLPAIDPPLPAAFVTTFYAMNIGVLSAIVFAMMAFFIYRKNLFQERSEMLLLSILPKQIANLLKASSRRIAHQHEAASILFADIVDFSGLARRMRPDELVDFLDDVFLEFDRLVEEDGLEKIKTIGDCYMVAAGVPQPREDHAPALARLALAMRRCSANRTFFGRRIDLRIGMNSGPVVAGVIGRKKFIYDLWGDAVNVASRMEASGCSGSIQVTRATRDLLGPGFVCEPAGVLNLKGIGETEVFQLVGESRAADRAESAPEPLRLGTAPLAPPVQARGRESGNAQRGKGSLP